MVNENEILKIYLTEDYDNVHVTVNNVPVPISEKQLYILHIKCDGSSSVKISAEGYKDYVFNPLESGLVEVELESCGLTTGEKVAIGACAFFGTIALIAGIPLLSPLSCMIGGTDSLMTGTMDVLKGSI